MRFCLTVLALGMTCMLGSCIDEDSDNVVNNDTSYAPYKIIEGYQDSIMYQLSGGVTAKNWMSMLDGSKKICKLSIPGTHDSATGQGFYNESLEYVFNLTAISQLTTIDEQLDKGIRFFDIRPVVATDTLTREEDLFCAHGISVINFTFENALYEIADFLIENPNEFVIVKLQGDNGVDNQRHWIPLMDDLIMNFSYKGKSDFFADWTPGMTVNDARGKILCINRTEYYNMKGAYCDWLDENADNEKVDTVYVEQEHDQVMYKVDLTDSTRLAAQDFYKTNNDVRMRLKKKAVLSMLQFATDSCTCNPQDNTWIINHTSAYTDVSPRGYFTNAQQVNPVVIDYLLEHPGKPVGIVVMDCAGYDMVKCIINGGNPYFSDYIDRLKPMSASLTNLLIMSNFK